MIDVIPDNILLLKNVNGEMNIILCTNRQRMDVYFYGHKSISERIIFVSSQKMDTTANKTI